jgi:hypothetical protein
MAKNIKDYVVEKVLENIESKNEEIEKLKNKIGELEKVLINYDIEKCIFCDFYTQSWNKCLQCKSFFCVDCQIGDGDETCPDCD